jgi:acyl-CoA thioester hydrolase
MDAPTSGAIAAGVHQLPVRIYYQDTDVSGFVYHANYLNFFERGRSEYLRLAGIDQRQGLEAPEAERAFFAIRDIAVTYFLPARLDDALVIRSWISALGAASVNMEQQVMREGQLIAAARLRIAVLGADGRPRRWPAPWRRILQDLSIVPDCAT